MDPKYLILLPFALIFVVTIIEYVRDAQAAKRQRSYWIRRVAKLERERDELKRQILELRRG